MRNPLYKFSSTAVILVLSLLAWPAQNVLAQAAVLVINEIDYDQASTDTAEFVEIKNTGTGSADLSDYSLVFINGSTTASYDTIALPAVSLAAGDYYVVCANAATVANCDLDDGPDTNFIQNGAPDAVALLQDAVIVDTVSYEGDTGAPYTEGSGSGLEDVPDVDNAGISRFPDGADTDSNNVDLSFRCSTPGEANVAASSECVPAEEAVLVINEIDYDQASTDTAEFVEIKNTGTGSADLSEYSLEFINGSTTAIYDTIALPAVSLAAGDYFVVCANAATVPNCDLDDGPDTNFIQNGAPDAVALLQDAVIIDTVSYEGDADAPYTEGSGTGLEDDSSVDNAGISRFPDGADTDSNNVDLSFRCSTPGAANSAATSDCVPPETGNILINEVDSDTPSTDDMEFVELYDGGDGNTALDGLVLVFFNGNGDTSYAAYDLDGFSTDANGYFLLGNAGVVPTPSIVFASNGLQNGADAVALYSADATDFPNGTSVSTTNLLDALVYDTNDSDDAGLLALLNAAEPQINEDGGGDKDNQSNQRCPDGSGGARNTSTYTQFAPTPAAPNCEVPPPPPQECGDPVTLIHDIQGNGTASPLDGQPVSIEGIVVGDFQDGAAGTHGDLNGFFVQEEDAEADADPMTSEGLFVFDGSSPAVDVQMGDKVRVAGVVDEFNGMTEITNTVFVEVCSPNESLPAATPVSLPFAASDTLEPVEGMYVTFPQPLTIVEYFNFDRFGEIVLATDRLLQPTAVFDPGSPEADALADLNSLSQITLDDGRTNSNPDPAFHPIGAEFDLGNLFRGGDLVANATGVINYSFGLYRIQPTQGADYTSVNLRTSEPDPVGGGLKFASFNVLNYFTTLDDGFNDICGPAQNQECRGADDAGEFTRQRDKIISAINALDADVVGLLEIENNIYDDAVIDLVDGLNAASAPGTWNRVDTGTIGTDAIKVAMIFKSAMVSELGVHAILDSSVDPRFIDTLNRPALAQTFQDNVTGGVFTLVVNHLKSKGSACDFVGDPDTGDGAGNCNLTRKMAAEALVDWLATDPTGSNDADVMVIGDLNSYDKEDPIDVFTGAGYTDLAYIFGGEFAYGYVFSAQVGYLDYALASPNLFAQTTGATDWHINADEPDLIDYDTSFKQAAQAAIYAPDAYRSSDHDPVIGGLDLLHFEFSGFFPPVKNLPQSNNVKAGSSVPLKFNLDGDQGLDIIAPGYPQSREIACDWTAPGAGESTVSDEDIGLTYDAELDEYKYVWKTSKSWEGSCRQLVVLLIDGSYHYANFEFK